MVHKMKGKWVSTDLWRGYYQPAYAVAGSSDTGMWSDSPAPTDEVKKELKMLSKYLKEHNIKTRMRVTRSSNAFMGKRWLVVQPKDYNKAKKLADKWLKKNYDNTFYIHDAD